MGRIIERFIKNHQDPLKRIVLDFGQNYACLVVQSEEYKHCHFNRLELDGIVWNDAVCLQGFIDGLRSMTLNYIGVFKRRIKIKEIHNITTEVKHDTFHVMMYITIDLKLSG